jgi:hypothetical protein
MKNLLEIFSEHPNWYKRKPENIPWKEMDSAADEYVQNLLAAGDRWKNIVAYDIEGYQGYEIAFGFKSDKEKKDFEYQLYLKKLTKRHFLLSVFNSLERFGFNVSEINLSPNDIKEWFSESDILTYGLDSSTPEQTALDKLLEEWNALGIMKRVLKRLEEKGLATKNGKAYNWKIDNDNDYPNNLYVYFVYIASDKFGWRFGKNKDRIPWNKFNPLFPNMANNQNALNQYLIEIKNGIFPRRATEIDDIVK